MVSRDRNEFLDREHVYAMLTKENEYAGAWGKGKESAHPAFPAHTVNRRTGQPFTESEWLDFTQKYIDEARLAIANYTPDMRAVRIRMMKAASLLVTALQVHGATEDIDDIAGQSSNKFPVLHGGLQTFKQMGGMQTGDQL